VFQRKKVAVFCDGDFWHGMNWSRRREKLLGGWNADYWISKIEYNRRRDRQNPRILKKAGWKVIRLWESEILRDPIAAATKVFKKIMS
jgi:DNA mismatch endonuclease (patch repair protein)